MPKERILAIGIFEPKSLKISSAIMIAFINAG